MKIKNTKAVEVALSNKVPKSKAKRQSWRFSAPIGLPMNKFEDFPPDVPGKSPGIAGKSVWAQDTVEVGTCGLGRTSFEMPVASLIDHFYAPLPTGRDCFATEHLNDMMWRASKRHGSV
tara:strand:- start:1106 stop:1462 length:357 start_codon:yes stop_codon:yes gene_type:complete